METTEKEQNDQILSLTKMNAWRSTSFSKAAPWSAVELNRLDTG